MKGLYLVPPHGELIAQGHKTSIAKSKDYGLAGDWILVSGKLAYGVMRLGEPEQVGVKEFDARHGSHKVDRRDRLRWWPEAETLWLYGIDRFEPFDEPRDVKVPAGVQTVMDEVSFKSDRSDLLLSKLAGLPDKFVWIPDFVSLTGSQIYAKDGREPNDVDVVLRAQDLDGEFYVTDEGAKTEVPVDAAFALKLERLLSDKLGVEGVQYVNNAYGPNWKSLSLYDLCLVRRPELKYTDVNEPEFAAMQYKAKRTLSQSHLDRALRGASREIKRQAKESFDKDEIKPGRMVLSLKPLRPASAGERQIVSHFYNYIEDNLEFPLYLSAKRDGATMYVHSDGKRIWFFSDDGHDRTDDLPNLVKAFKEKYKGKSLVAGVELERWIDGEHYPREAAIGDVKKGNDENLVANVFRVAYWDGKDLHNEPFEQVWSEVTSKMPADSKSDGKLYPKRDGPINVVPHYKVAGPDALKKRLESVAYKPGVEGVIVKRADGTFPLDGEPGDPPTSIKFHKSFPAIVRITDKTETRTAKVYVYTFSIGDMEIGKTFGSALDLKVDSNLEIEGEQLNVERDEAGDISKVTVWAPEVMSPTDKKSESLQTIVTRARKHGVLREKVRKEDDSIEYLPNEPGDPATADKAWSDKALEGYPDESKKLRYVVQVHFRGKSAHADPRFEYKRGKQNYLRGWTIPIQQPGAIKKPVTTMEAAKRAIKNTRNWKMNLDTGIIKPRRIRGGVVRRGNLRAFPKGVEVPKDWINVEGVTEEPDPGEPIPAGATRLFPGVFVIVAKGNVDWGAQKAWFKELFLDGNWKGRWTFRLVKREKAKYWLIEDDHEAAELAKELGFKSIDELQSLPVMLKQELPPGVEEEDERVGAFWQLMQPLDQTPYSLSKKAVSSGWLPPFGVSALPRRIRQSVPKELRYWTIKDRGKAKETRDRLAEFEELGGTELKDGVKKFIVLQEIQGTHQFASLV